MVRSGARQNRLVSTALVIVLACLAPGSAEAAEVDAGIDLAPVRLEKSVLIRTKDDRWIKGKPFAVSGDTLILKKGSRRNSWLVRVRAADIDGAWTPRPAPARRALVLGVGGFVGGVLLGIGLGPECPDCPIDAGDVLKQAAIEGAFDAAFGAFLGLFGGRSKQLLPPVAEGDGAEPYSPYAATIVLGAAGVITDRSSAGAGTEQFQARSTTWITGSPSGGWGLEYGTLTGGEGSHRGLVAVPVDTILVPYYGHTYESSGRSRWGYATLQHRWRARRGTVRPEITLGFGTYGVHSSGSSARFDSLGVLISRTEWERTSSGLGINLGTGLTLGQGPFHPGIDVRAHWAIEPAIVWYTLGLKADWH